MGKYKPYPEYKASGVEWLGDVPEVWKIGFLKFYASVKGGYAFPSELFSDEGVPVIRIGDIKPNGTICLTACKCISNDFFQQYAEYRVVAGDILMAMTGATIGKAGKYRGEKTALLNQRVGSYSVKVDALAVEFLEYLIETDGYQEHIKLTAFGGAQANISDTGMLAYVCPLPSSIEQIQIAAFLDHETVKIDRLIEKQEKLIKLLKEKRQAVISYAVTKGLNPDAPMKDSGVEWLKEVPEHWEISELRHHTKWLGGGTPSKDKLAYWDGDIPWVSPKDMKVECIEKTLDQITEQAVAESSVIEIPKDNILIVVRGMILARTVPVAIAGCNLTINQDMKALLPAQNLLGKFLLYYLLGARQRLFDLVEEAAHGTKCLRTELARRLEIVIPPLAEQSALILEIEKRRMRLSDLINKAGNAIQLLKDRRTALISAAVTGKIDVRDWNKD